MHIESVAQLYTDMVAEAAVVGLDYPVALACDAAAVGFQSFVLVPEGVQSGVLRAAFRAVVMELWHQTRLNEDEHVRMDSFLAAMRKRYEIR